MNSKQERKIVDPQYSLGLVQLIDHADKVGCVEGSTQIYLDERPKATGKRISCGEVVRRYGMSALLEMDDKGTFLKPEGDWWDY